MVLGCFGHKSKYILALQKILETSMQIHLKIKAFELNIVDNIEAKGEIAHYKQLIRLEQRFQIFVLIFWKLSSADLLYVGKG